MKRAISLAAAALCLLLTGCFGPAPGHGAKANVGFRTGERVIVALDRFQGEHGHYPTKAEELVPRYLPSPDALAYTYHGDPNRVFYHREKDGSFSLEFGYVAGFPSYMNSCSYTSKTRRWRCVGYY